MVILFCKFFPLKKFAIYGNITYKEVWLSKVSVDHSVFIKLAA